MRPTSFDDFIGQKEVVEQIKLAISSAAKRGKNYIDHIILSGPPGLGKTTIAQIIAKRFGGRYVETAGNILRTPADMLSQIINLRDGDVIFVDEIHAIPPNVQEYLYPAMEDYTVSAVSQVAKRQTVTIRLNKFVLVGATTIEGQLTQPLLSRFGIVCKLDPYSKEDIVEIVRKAAARESIMITPGALKMVADRARSTPRIALRQFRRIQDSATMYGDPKFINEHAAEHAYKILRIGEHGLTEQDHIYLKAIASNNYASGLSALSSITNIDSKTIETVVEPHLLRIGAIVRTPSGRRITDLGRSFGKL